MSHVPNELKLILTMSFLCQHTASSPISTLSLHDALPISSNATAGTSIGPEVKVQVRDAYNNARSQDTSTQVRSEEHTSELQSRFDLVCRLLLEKKNFTARGSDEG